MGQRGLPAGARAERGRRLLPRRCLRSAPPRPAARARAPPHPSPHAPDPRRLSDQGGGIAEADAASVWQFGFTTTGRHAGGHARRRRHGGHGAAGAAAGAGSSGEAGGRVAEGLGLDNAPPGVSFGAAWAAMEGSMAGMGRFRIAGA